MRCGGTNDCMLLKADVLRMLLRHTGQEGQQAVVPTALLLPCTFASMTGRLGRDVLTLGFRKTYLLERKPGYAAIRLHPMLLQQLLHICLVDLEAHGSQRDLDMPCCHLLVAC